MEALGQQQRSTKRKKTERWNENIAHFEKKAAYSIWLTTLSIKDKNITHNVLLM